MVAPVLPSLDQARRDQQEAEKEQAFWEENYQRLREQYPDQFVAVQQEQVIGNSPDLAQLVVTLQTKGVNPLDVWVRYVSTKSHRLLL